MSKKEKLQQESAKKKKKSSLGSLLGTLFVILLFAAVVIGVVKVGIPIVKMYKEAVEMVENSDENTFKASQTSIVYDAEGKELKKLKGEKDVYYLKYEDISDAAKLALISVEDKKFATHHGIDVIGLARSVVSLVIHRGQITQGGSTITQQLARNIFLSFEQTYTRKIKEIFVAFAMEEKYSKEQILEFYLNNVYFANGNYGIEAASQAYFNKSCKDLTISQTAFLCAIPNSPTRYDPYENPEGTLARRDHILTNMYNDGYITKDQYEKSLAEEITVMPKKENSSNDYALTYILKCATEELMEEQGFTLQTSFSSEEEKESYDEKYDELYSTCRQSLYTGGYRIYTSIDVSKQEQLQNSVATQLDRSFIEKTDDGVYKVQGAAVCIDNSSGKVCAIVGGREEDQEGYGLNRAYQSFRQPGSAIKPLVVFTPAFEQGYSPDSTVDDSAMTGSDKVNNAGGSYSGSISLRKAVQKSSNVVTYRMYQEMGGSSLLSYLEKMNFAGLDDKDYQYDTTCIGGFTNGTTPVEMAAGYATLANNGTYRKPTCIVKITDAQGEDVVSESDCSTSKSIYTNQAARTMTNVLASCVTDSDATASDCDLDINIPVACKTGTTSDYVDGWLCGYSPYYTTAVWVGMDVYQSVDNLKGNTYPAYIWKDFMDAIHQNVTRDMDLEADFGSYLEQEQERTEAEDQEEEEEEEDLNQDQDLNQDFDNNSNEDSDNDANDYYNSDDYNINVPDYSDSYDEDQNDFDSNEDSYDDFQWDSDEDSNMEGGFEDFR